jgi:hypothetical protein
MHSGFYPDLTLSTIGLAAQLFEEKHDGRIGAEVSQPENTMSERVRVWAGWGASEIISFASSVGRCRLRALFVSQSPKTGHVRSLVERCRLKVEELILYGDIPEHQLQHLTAHYLSLPLPLVRDLVHSLFIKSLTNLFPLRYHTPPPPPQQ